MFDPPDLGPVAAYEPAGPAEVSARAELVGRTLTGVTLTGGLARLSLEECVLDEVRVDAADLTGWRLRDVRIAGLDAPSLRAARSHWHRVELSRSRIGGAEWYDAHWRSVRIADSKLGFVNLRGARLEDVVLTGCRIDELDLGGAEVARLSLAGCTVGALDLTGAELTDVDLRGAELAALTGPAGLRGATVDQDQLALLAPILAAHLGLHVL